MKLGKHLLHRELDMKENIQHHTILTSVLGVLIAGSVILGLQATQLTHITTGFLSAIIIMVLYHHYWFSEIKAILKVGLITLVIVTASAIIANLTGLQFVLIAGKVIGTITIGSLMTFAAILSYNGIMEKNKLFDRNSYIPVNNKFFVSTAINNLNGLLTICRQKEAEGICVLSNKNDHQQIIWIESRFAGVIDYCNESIFIHNEWLKHAKRDKRGLSWKWLINGVLNNTPMKTSFLNSLKNNGLSQGLSPQL